MRFSDRSTRFAHSGASSRTTSSTSIAPGTSAAASSCGAARSSGCRCRWWGSSRARAAAGTRSTGSGGTPATQADVKVKPGGVFRSGLQLPGSDLDPLIVQNQGALGTLGQSGEFLIYSDRDLNAGAAAGRELEAERRRVEVDVQDPPGRQVPERRPDDDGGRRGDVQPPRRPRDNGSNALSAFTGVLSNGGAQATDESTVVFELEAPNGNFPFTTSSDNYNLIILPKGFDPKTWPKTFMGTGPWKMEKYTPERGRELHEEPRLLGQDAASRCPTATRSSTTRRKTPRSSACRAARSTCSRSSPRPTARRCSPIPTSR